MPRPPSDWISLGEASALLAGANVRFSAATIGRWAREGRLQTIKLGGRRYVRRAQIRALLRPRRRVSGDELGLQTGLFEEL